MSAASLPTPSSLPKTTSTPSASTLTTGDLWLGAFLLTEGGVLRAVHLFGQRTRYAVRFEFSGPDLGELEAAYLRGDALGNVTRLKSALAHLKDVMFARIRAEDDRRSGGRAENTDDRRSGGREGSTDDRASGRGENTNDRRGGGLERREPCPFPSAKWNG